jgi:AbrB family looped-hinge helix DNA binding protein
MKTRISTKGQVILPKILRDRLHWKPGMELDIEARPDGVLLKANKGKKKGSILDFAGILKYDGPPKTIEEMNAGIIDEVRRRHARGRY